LKNASKDCDAIFHLAAYAQPWAKNLQTYHDVNVDGTVNVLEAAKFSNVNRVIVTATAGTFGPQVNDELITEEIQQVLPPFTEYERTKQIANERVKEYITQGMDIVTVSPTRIYGPGALSASNAVTKLLERYMYNGFRYLPGNGLTSGNYAFIQDMINGHYLAAVNGKTGENYILGGENLTYRELLDAFGQVSGVKRKSVEVPLPILMGAARTMQFFGDNFGIAPAVTPPFIRKYTVSWATDISKAKEQLGYTVTPFVDGIKQTANWIRTEREG